MLVKELEIKNISNEVLTFENYTININDIIQINLNDIDTAAWKNIIGLVNKGLLDYKVIKIDVEDKKDEMVEEVKEEKSKTTKKTDTKKSEDTKATTIKKTKKKKE